MMKTAYVAICKWLTEKSDHHRRKEHLKKYGCDIKCPHCDQWFSLSGRNHKHEIVDRPDWGIIVECGECSWTSYWNLTAAPVPLRCDVSGNPISSRKDKE